MNVLLYVGAHRKQTTKIRLYSYTYNCSIVFRELFILRFYESPIPELQIDTRIMEIELGKKN